MSYLFSLTYTLQRKPVTDHSPVVTKICSECGHEKNKDEFANHMLGIGGVTSKCKECLNSAARDAAKAKKERRNDYAFQ